MILRKAVLAAGWTCVCVAIISLQAAAATSATPFGGSAVVLPGTIEAENFDDGGASVAYFDTTVGNRGGVYRQTDVDIEATSDIGGGWDVAWTRAGEWLQYTARVTTAGTYALELRVASASTGGIVRVDVDGADVTGPLTVPNTGGWQTWTTIRKDGIAIASGTHRIRLVFVAAGTNGIANVNFLRITPSAIVPSPWSNSDVGQPALAGTAAFASNVFTVKGSGADIGGTSDAFQFVAQSASGDTQIVARVTSMDNTSASAKAAVMLRESTAADAATVILDVEPSGNIEFMTRPTKGSVMTYVAGTAASFPAWLKLARIGTTLVGSVSSDGATWRQVGNTTASATLGFVGLAVNSHSTLLNTSVFDNVTVGAPPAVLPAPPTVPTALTPANGAASVPLNVPLSWSASGAAAYDVRFGTSNPPPAAATGLTTATYTPASIANDTTYYWQIAARNSGGTTISPVWSFRTVVAQPATPTAGAPANGGTGVAVNTQLAWTANGATSYDVRIGTTNPPAVAASGLAAASYTPATLANNTTYYWQVVASNAGGSTPSPVWSFTTIVAAPATPSAVLPGNAATGIPVNATLSWSATGATTYDVRFGTTNPPPAAAAGLAGTTSYTPAGLTNETTYYWQVAAQNAGGTTVGPVWSFTTVVAPPSAPTALAPADNAIAVANPLLSWNASRATSYDVRLGTTNPPSGAVTGIAASSYAPPALATGTTYYWQVVARNDGGATEGPVWSFMTAGVPVPWTSRDVGAVVLPGSANYANGTFTVAGAGADIWGTADAFQFVSQPVSGDVQIVARVVSLQATQTKAKAGIMLRESTAPDAAHVLLDVKPGGAGVEFMTRATAGGLTTKSSNTIVAAPVFVRLTRSGSTVTGAISADGVTWTTVGIAPAAGTWPLAGLVVNSHDVTRLNTAVFDNVAISVPPPPPPPPPPPIPGSGSAVPPGGDVQAALDAAPAGGTVYLTAGATYTQNIVFRQRGSVTLTTQGFAVPAGTRVGPSDAPTMAKIVCSDCFSPTIGFEFGSHDVNVIGVEVIGNPSQPDHPTINIGNHPSSWATAPTVADQPSNITFDRMYEHAESTGGRQGILTDGVNVKVLNSYISGFWLSGQDSQAVGMIQGAGPVLVQNNYLEASGENILVGGSDPIIVGLIPADITVKDNYFFKPLSWKTAHPGSVKNLFELKNAQRVIVDHNVFENVWIDGQAGSAILFTVRNQGGNCPWCVVKDVTFTNNIVKNVANFAFNVLGTDDAYTSAIGANLVIKNNLILDANGGALIQSPLNGIEFSHNTFVNISSKFLALGSITTGSVVNGFVFRDNAVQAGSYGITGDGTAAGTASLQAEVAPGYVFTNNLIEQSSERYIPFPSGNYVTAPGTYASKMNLQYAIIDATCVASEGGGVLVGADVTKLPR